MKFSILDEEAWKKYSGTRLYSAFITVARDGPASIGREREWVCETRAKYLVVKYFGGMVTVGCATRWDDMKNRMSLIGRVAEKKEGEKIKFSDIKNFMQWQIKDDDYID